MEPGSIASRISTKRRMSSHFQKRRYPPCGAVDFLNVRKGRCFLEPLWSRPKKSHTFQQINGMYSKDNAKVTKNYKFIHCVLGTPPPISDQGSFYSDMTSQSVYTTDSLVSGKQK